LLAVPILPAFFLLVLLFATRYMLNAVFALPALECLSAFIEAGRFREQIVPNLKTFYLTFLQFWDKLVLL
jgi:hypothetical protein